MTPVLIVYIPIALVVSYLADAGIQLHSRQTGRVFLRGQRDCSGLLFADAIREAGGNVWLAWSKSQVTLLTIGEHEPQVLWRSPAQQRPALKVAKTNLRWPDGSSVEFSLSSEERTRVVERNGTP
ncbi:hypothetical protein FHU35_11967 [Saccharopolyspora dendranthemae]|uniref:Uncharacterized protein n=1 Tax=Saccharopolyspora dendranthemae TaxID=1181886 RepID=A0A561V9Q9_9PSEU|nr:hypothetical protein FHU35_11967 [Saccharopolyspora dendranthemae]